MAFRFHAFNRRIEISDSLWLFYKAYTKNGLSFHNSNRFAKT